MVADSMTTMLSINQVLTEESGKDIKLIASIMDHAERNIKKISISCAR